MITHPHPHPHGSKKATQSHPTELWRGLHKNWRTWAVIAVMLAAIGTYVLTLDESIQPGASRSPVPTATAPTPASK
ncbi:MAG: hypothetical protein WC443_03175 [Desulfobaccales bacterium]